MVSGERIGPYTIVEKLGEGGMGQVWRATDTTLGRQVAIKILPDAFAADPERLVRFEREAKASRAGPRDDGRSHARGVAEDTVPRGIRGGVSGRAVGGLPVQRIRPA